MPSISNPALARALIAAILGAGVVLTAAPGSAQQAPTAADIAAYRGLHAAAATGDLAAIRRLAADRQKLNARDGWGRTPLMVAVHRKRVQAVAALIKAGADLDALDRQKYDAVTIAAVAGHAEILKLLLGAGAKPGQTTSPYDGTALIAAAHRGHPEIVSMLIMAGAPLDHVNNLGWTALIEAIVLGDGGKNHVAIVDALVKGGADVNIPDRHSRRPLTLARARGYMAMVAILVKAGAKP